MRKNCLANPPLSKYFEPPRTTHVAVREKHPRQITGVYEVVASQKKAQQ